MLGPREILISRVIAARLTFPNKYSVADDRRLKLPEPNVLRLLSTNVALNGYVTERIDVSRYIAIK